jgi:hypothetical protein
MLKFLANFLWSTCFAALVIALLSESADAQEYAIREVMSGLASPRGMAFGPDGNLYVAEAGRGGNGPSIVLGTGQQAFYGTTGGLSRLRNGVQERVISGLPSVAHPGPGGVVAQGLADIVFDGSGNTYGVIGLGGDPRLRSNLGAPGADFGTLVRLSLDAGQLERIADLGAHEIANNPDGGPIDSNPFGLALAPEGDFLIADAGANDFLGVNSAGSVRTLAFLPNRPNTLPFGPPTLQSVPTAVDVGPDGAYYIGELTGGPFPPGASIIHRFDPATGNLTVAHTGFTNITDLTFDGDGNLYVLQMTTNGLTSAMGPGPGKLIKIEAVTGNRTTIASAGLMFPGSVVAAPDGGLYVTNVITSPNAGQVLHITLVPEEIIAGDFNEDGVVDAADYVVWRKGLGSTYTQNDFNVWRANFGQNTDAEALPSQAAVPEPVTLVHLMFAASWYVWRRRTVSKVSATH